MKLTRREGLRILLRGAAIGAGVADTRDVLAKADALGEAVSAASPVALLRRVFGEQFEIRDGAPARKRAADAGAVVNPHDPEAQWSTKKTLGKEGWHGYKAQVCESVEDAACAKGEPTKAVVTAILVQPATGSDHGSVPGILAEHRSAVGPECLPPDEVHVDAVREDVLRLSAARAMRVKEEQAGAENP